MEFLLVADFEQCLFADNAVVQVRLGMGGIAATHLDAASRGGSRGRRCVAWHSVRSQRLLPASLASLFYTRWLPFRVDVFPSAPPFS